MFHEHLKNKTNHHTIFQDFSPNDIQKIASLELIFILRRMTEMIILLYVVIRHIAGTGVNSQMLLF